MMQARTIAIALLLLTAAGITGCGSEKMAVYGEDFSVSGKELPKVSEVVSDTTMHDREIVLTGMITDVCQKKGCWIVVTDGTEQMRITFKDYGFFVPTDAFDREVVLKGVVSVETIDEETAKHYAEESKDEDPDAIVGPQRVVTMVASGVRMAEG